MMSDKIVISIPLAIAPAVATLATRASTLALSRAANSKDYDKTISHLVARRLFLGVARSIHAAMRAAEKEAHAA
jgi:hypothetical protein